MTVEPRRVARALWLAVIGLTLAGFGGQIAKHLLGFDFGMGLIDAFDLNHEHNIPAWFSSSMLVLSAVLLSVVAAEAWQAKRPYASHWSGLAILGAAATLMVLLVYWRFIFALSQQTRRGLLLAAALYVGGAIGLEMASGYYISRTGMNHNLTVALLATVEEFLEMSGVVVLIHAILSHLGQQTQAIRIRQSG